MKFESNKAEYEVNQNRYYPVLQNIPFTFELLSVFLDTLLQQQPTVKVLHLYMFQCCFIYFSDNHVRVRHWYKCLCETPV